MVKRTTKRRQTLPKVIRDTLKRIVVDVGSEKAVDKDPFQVLSALLYAVEQEIPYPHRTTSYIVREYCSPDGLARYAHRVKESQAKGPPKPTVSKSTARRAA